MLPAVGAQTGAVVNVFVHLPQRMVDVWNAAFGPGALPRAERRVPHVDEPLREVDDDVDDRTGLRADRREHGGGRLRDELRHRADADETDGQRVDAAGGVLDDRPVGAGLRDRVDARSERDGALARRHG